MIDWPAFGTGTPNDYSPVQRQTETKAGTARTACAEIIAPDKKGQNSGSSIKVVVEVKQGTNPDGSCTGAPLEDVTGGTFNLTLAISGTGTGPNSGVLVIYCGTPGESLGCFTQVPGQPGRLQSTVDLTNPPIVPDDNNDYIFSVTSVNVPSANPGTQNSGVFPPIFGGTGLHERIELRRELAFR